MKIHISHNNWCKGRILPLYTTLCKYADVTMNDSLDEIPSSDVWIVDWYDVDWNKIPLRINAHEEQFLKYGGKLLPVSLDDGCIPTTHSLKRSIVERIDGWITGILWDRETKIYDDSLWDKFIMVPRFVLDYRVMEISPNKTNQIVFWGSTTGGLKLAGQKNPRVECFKKIDEHPYVKEHFRGGLVFDYIIDCQESTEYRESFQKFVVPIIHNTNWWEMLNESTLCPNLEGNGLFSYRPLESMRSKAAIISPPFFKDPGTWLYADKLKDCVWFYKRDLSDFIEVCESALRDESKTQKMADEAFEVYKDYFETGSDNTYNKIVMKQFNDKFEKLTGLQIL